MHIPNEFKIAVNRMRSTTEIEDINLGTPLTKEGCTLEIQGVSVFLDQTLAKEIAYNPNQKAEDLAEEFVYNTIMGAYPDRFNL